jgi:20S proteasome alpha/beta subunit
MNIIKIILQIEKKTPKTPKTCLPSPGRLFQVEYALEAINKTPPTVGIVCTDGIILIAEKRATSALVERMNATEKIHQIDQNTICAVTGLTADANQLLLQARQYSQQHLYTYRSYPSIESIVLEICNLKQSYTQFGGLRPFGVGFLIAGWDEHHGYQLYSTDPAGNYAVWAIKIIGQGSSGATRKVKEICVKENKERVAKDDTLTDDEKKKKENDDCYVAKNIIDSLPLAGRLLADSLSVDSIKPEGVEGAVLKFDHETKQMIFHILNDDELKDLTKKANEILEGVNKADE